MKIYYLAPRQLVGRSGTRLGGNRSTDTKSFNSMCPCDQYFMFAASYKSRAAPSTAKKKKKKGLLHPLLSLLPPLLYVYYNPFFYIFKTKMKGTKWPSFPALLRCYCFNCLSFLEFRSLRHTFLIGGVRCLSLRNAVIRLGF